MIANAEIETAPSKNGIAGTDDGQRDKKSGRFVKGNAGGPGNPEAARVFKLRWALLRAVDTDDIQAVIQALIRKARRGSVPAARELLNRVLGKPRTDDSQLEAMQASIANLRIVLKELDAQPCSHCGCKPNH